MNISRHIAFYIVFVFGLFLFSIWTLISFHNTYNLLTKHTQLSAWSLSQLEIETLEFSNQLDLFLLRDRRSLRQLNLKYDILWNRFDTFLTSDETEAVRLQGSAQPIISAAFDILRKYEAAVIAGRVEALNQFSDELKSYMPLIRNLIITTLTGEESVRSRAIIEENKQTVLYNMALILVVLAYLSFRVYRDTRYQKFMAWHDPLTKLKNRNFLLKQIRSLGKQRADFSLVLLDICHFREINDVISYEYGDRILSDISHIINQHAEHYQLLCARVGADQFAIVVDRLDINLDMFIASLRSELDSKLQFLDPSRRMHIAIGIASSDQVEHTHPQQSKKFSVLLNNADLALNVAKKEAAQRIIYFTKERDLAHRKKRELCDELKVLLSIDDQQQLFMVYQPIINPGCARLGCEALLRWDHPTYGFINPEYLIRIAEESGQAKALGRWIMEQVYRALSTDWHHFDARIDVAINLSDSLFDEELSELVQEIFSREKNYLDSIVLEITETMTLDEIDRSVSIIRRLEDLNIRLALDDFGTGWSSLYNLNHLRFNKLKIDKSFVRDLCTMDQQKFFISAIVTLSHQLGIKVVAEGVEDEIQLHHLQQLGVDEYQGYYFSKPISKQLFALFSQQYFANPREKVLSSHYA
ncbi:putative bifunctional diguanylate cyclase/phosphodiesterase [Vibrio ostreae]|uniref:putative bifunctional diguanylate cyclase/phosphodiesterase n=1 Tax=Vibrio ostreae TaxID=2841925 RepID=UPI002113AFE6|nr:bifunctional diguanylate cyclase/phosphodiesterase [Vibrio ostreae]